MNTQTLPPPDSSKAPNATVYDSRPKESQSSSRWWEFYAIRYGMGTVIGGIIFYFLCRSNDIMKPMLLGIGVPNVDNVVTLDGNVLILLAGYGLAYCYISSAPILVFHAGRFLLRPASKDLWDTVARFLFMLIPPLSFASIFYCENEKAGSLRVFFFTVFFLLCLISWFQYLIIGLTLCKTEKLWSFYQELAAKREVAKGGIVDSYRHLREHGNSFSIVLCEIVLGIILFGTGKYAVAQGSNGLAFYTAAILFWIFPAALVWVVGTLFERRFIE